MQDAQRVFVTIRTELYRESRQSASGLDPGAVHADSEGVITSIHHADAPGPDEDGNNQQYPGQGQYVLEINKDWTTARDIEAGDVLVSEAIA